jgi:hypothetical protein
MTKEYAIYGRMVGMVDEKPRRIGEVQANSHADALRAARRTPSLAKITGVKLIGVLNPKYVPEKHLMAAIFGKRYRQKKYLLTRRGSRK